jgi:hypothetical protein
MSAIEMLRGRSEHAWCVVPSGVCVQLRRPTQAQLREAGLAMLPGLIEAAQVTQEAEDEAQVAAGKPAEKVAEHRATKEARRMERAMKHFARHPELADQLQSANDAWVCAAVVAIGVAADEVEPGVYGTAPAMLDGAALEAGGFTIGEPADRVLPVSALVASERTAIASAAQRHSSARERLRPVVASTRAPAGV